MESLTTTDIVITKNIPRLRFPEFDGEWTDMPFESLFTIGNGKDFKHLKEGNIPVYGTGGYMCSVDDYLHDGESICIGRKGTINKPFYLNTKLWTVDTLFYTHSFSKESYVKFIYYKFLTINWKIYNEASGVPSLSKSTLYKIKINLPSLPEQQKIANFLAQVDRKIELLDKQQAALEEYKKGVMQKIFNQEIRFKIKNEAGELVKPPEWEEKELGEIASKKSSSISANQIEDNEGEYKIYGATGFLKKVDFYEEEGKFISIVKDGAGVGRVLLCDEFSSVLGTLDILKPRREVNLYFLYSILQLMNFLKFKIGSTIPHIYFKDYSKAIIKIPSLEEQDKIADFLSAIDTKIEAVAERSRSHSEWKKGLLQKMFV